jgi:hypothetical protein
MILAVGYDIDSEDEVRLGAEIGLKALSELCDLLAPEVSLSGISELTALCRRAVPGDRH